MHSKRVTTESDLKKVFHIRKAVFVKEQGIPLEDEFDESDTLDSPCEHILVYYHDKAAGAGRLVRDVDGLGKLERICILAPYRKLGLGKIIIQTLEKIAKSKKMNRIKLHGQTQAEGFYKKLGYQRSSNVFIEDGIPHIVMIKELSMK